MSTLDRNAAGRSEIEAKVLGERARNSISLLRCPPANATLPISIATDSLQGVTTALHRFPKNAGWYLTRACIYRMLGRNRLAVCDINAALLLDPRASHLYAR